MNDPQQVEPNWAHQPQPITPGIPVPDPLAPAGWPADEPYLPPSASGRTYQGGIYPGPAPAPAWPPAAWPAQRQPHHLVQAQPAYHQAPPAVIITAGQSSTGIPAWMIAFYIVGGLFTCGVLWVVGLRHWWRSERVTRTSTTSTFYPPR